MIRAWRIELLWVAGLISMSGLVGLFLGAPRPLLVATLVAYLGWHLGNLLLLQIWLARKRAFRLPLSLGAWEFVFDGFQRRELHGRRRTRRLIGALSDCREAAVSLPDALVVLSGAGTITWFNPAAGRLLGLRCPADLGKAITTLVPHPALADDLAEGRSSQPLQVPAPANGAWMLSLQVTAPFGERRERLLVARDITSVFRLEQSRRDFLASVSHELKTPITVFRGYLEALREAAADQPGWRKPVANMSQQAQRMQALVDDLLTLSRLEIADRSRAEAPLQVSRLLADIVAEARALSGERAHDLHLIADPEVWLFADEADLYSAFSNLVFNAVRHTPPHTGVEIRWQATADGGAGLSVRDRGPGIAAEHLPRLTERFYRVEAGRSRSGGGSGLGLAIVKQVLERYGTDLRIISAFGEGTTFSCRFPAALSHIEPPAELSKAG